MNINKNNYEAYFLDYHEGNLSPQEVADLFLFLSQHPELKKELDDFENIILDDFSAPVFENKESLKKNITPDNREDYFIRAIEDDLDANEIILLQTFLTENPDFLKEFNLLKKTKLQTDASLFFENKQELKQLTETDQRLISAIEGLLTKNEQTQLETELIHNAELKKEFTRYQYTKSIADSSIVFSDRQKLKRRERKVVPLFYYVSAAAAAVAIIIGLFFMFRTSTDLSNPVAQQKNTTPKQPAIIPLQTEHTASPTTVANITTKEKKKFHKKNVKKQQPAVISTEDMVIKTPDKSGENIAAVTTITDSETKTELKTQSNLVDSSIAQSKQNAAPILARTEKKPAQSKTPEYLSIGDLFATKLKEKLVGKDALNDSDKSNSSKVNGWDIAGAFARGLTNLTGKKIAIKPQFNNEGEVTAYAFSAGKIEFSRVK